MKTNVEIFYDKYVHGLPKGALVRDATIVLVNLTTTVQEGCSLPFTKIYITSRTLKHIHEKRSPYEFNFIINNIWAALKYPDFVYDNIKGKRGNYLFVKKMRDSNLYICSIEQKPGELDSLSTLFVATAFKNTNVNYLSKCKLIWSWKGGTPSS